MRALITIFDEKTGYVFEKDKILEPYVEQRDPRLCITEYEYRFKHSIMDGYFLARLDGEIEPNKELLKEAENSTSKKVSKTDVSTAWDPGRPLTVDEAHYYYK